MRRLWLFLLLFLTGAALSACAASGGIISQKIVYPSRGISVHATLCMPEGKTQAPIVILAHGHHGTRDERFGLRTLADSLARSGIASIRMDFSGCGESTEPFSANCLTNMKADVLSAIQYAQAHLQPSAVGLYGYSMGGRIVLELLAEGAVPDAVAMLAPAADTQDLIRTTFGSFFQEYEALKSSMPSAAAGSEEKGVAWYEDLLRYEDPAAAASAAYHGPALVLWAQDDAIVSSSVSAHVANMLHAEVYDASGKGHGYGFFLEDDELLRRIVDAEVGFFVRHLD